MAKEKLPFITQNRTLAIALHMGGCRIQGVYRVFPNREAALSGDGGKVQFFLEDGPNRAALEAAFDSATDCKKMDLPNVSDEDAAKLAHLVLILRAEIVERLRDPASAAVFDEKGAPTSTKVSEGEYVINHPGGTLHGLTTAPAVIQQLRQYHHE